MAACAYAVFVIHASFDWDWELPAVTVAGLWCGVALMADPASFGESRASRSVRCGCGRGHRDRTKRVWPRRKPRHCGKREGGTSRRYGKALAWARAAGRWQPWSYVPDLEQGAAYEARGDLGSAAVAYRRSTEKDSSAWHPWFALAQVTEGAQQADALARARALNPESRQIDAFCSTPQRSGVRPSRRGRSTGPSLAVTRVRTFSGRAVGGPPRSPYR